VSIWLKDVGYVKVDGVRKGQKSDCFKKGERGNDFSGGMLHHLEDSCLREGAVENSHRKESSPAIRRKKEGGEGKSPPRGWGKNIDETSY